ncbi:MAG TPA: tetraacyldisaccharide 4'-kinase, partial [Lacipirellulaceae bacterium]|nr:tetraacyldisaccharide 4'-kinase [Lacipirellulaceae bacterium]
MLRPTEFRNLVSGQQKGPAAAFMRGVLRVAEVPYTIAVTARNRRYDRGAASIHSVEAPVISVGN